MHWVSRISTAPDLETAVDEVSEGVLDGLGGTQPDLAIVFIAAQHRSAGWVQLPAWFGERLGGAVLLGCCGTGIVGGGREIQHEAAVSLLAGHLPGVTLTPFHLSPESIPPPGTSTADYNARLGISDDPVDFIVLPDPLSTRASDFVSALDAAYPESTIVGGLASGGEQPGQHTLIAGHESFGAGVVGLALSGNVCVDSVVAQGCRPIGTPLFVTRGDNGIIHELDSRRPSDVLRDLAAALSERDRKLMHHSLLLGVAMAEGHEVYRQGDFLIRNIVGIDASSGAMAVGTDVHQGQVVQFQLRDAETSSADLERMLARHVTASPGRPAGALMFSCVGRGQRLYGEPDHDSTLMRRHLGPVPLGGFFCNGEIGPVAGRTFVHGYTSAFALFRRKLSD